jgi:queuine tRNA-ribosyltransferase
VLKFSFDDNNKSNLTRKVNILDMDYLETRKGKIKLPVFMPDATRATVKSITSSQIKDAGVRMIVANTFHLMLRPGAATIKKLGGLHKFMNYDGPILTDSGGFQVFSLIHKSKLGSISDDGALFKSPLDGTEHLMTPEISIDVQLALDSDILVALDEPVATDATKKLNEESVRRTTEWGRRAKEHFLKQPEEVRKGKKIFAVVQGAMDKKMRKRSMEELGEIGFDGYDYGGWPLDMEANRLDDILAYTAEIMDKDKPKYAMGVGMPEDITACFKMGYNMFDCVIPTRNARHGFLFVTTDNGGEEKEGYEILRINNSKFIEDAGPIDKNCECYACKNYSRGYLSHLFRVSEPLAGTLATIHNLYFYEEWTNALSLD